MIRSMTGFVTKRIFLPRLGEVTVNIRSLNFKYLDIHISRTPLGFEEIERIIYKEAVARIRRGRLEISVNINQEVPQKVSAGNILAVKKIVKAALDELLEFKKIQGRAVKKDIRAITEGLTRRAKFFGRYLKKISQDKDESTKDIFEEVSLVSFYLEHLSTILKKEKKELGKILDFLSQELLRETNTILAKVKDKRLSLEAVYFKEGIDRLRELAQNIE